MDIKKIEIDKLIPAIYNPRKNLKPDDAEYKKIKRSIEQFGYVEPVIWNKRTGFIVGGHQRIKVLKDLGYKEVDCVVIDIDENNEKALNVALNKISGEWDFELLGSLLEELKEEDFDVTLTGFEMDDIEGLLNMDSEEKEVKEDDFNADEALENIEEPISKRGDIWLLNSHRLICGDSTSIDDINILMNGKKADMVFTDPPYLISTQGGGALQKCFNKTADRIRDIVDFNPKDFLEVLPSVFDKCMNTYIFCNKDLVPNYLNYAKENKYNFNILTWCKKQVVPFTGGHHYSDIEYIIYLTKNPIFNNGLNDVTYRKYFVLDNEKSKDHPTIKPQEIIYNEIKISSNKNGIVVDFFGGSGSTLIASEQTNRICYMMELDEKYCDVIVNRYINFKNSSDDVFLIREGKKMKYSEVVQM